MKFVMKYPFIGDYISSRRARDEGPGVVEEKRIVLFFHGLKPMRIEKSSLVGLRDGGDGRSRSSEIQAIDRETEASLAPSTHGMGIVSEGTGTTRGGNGRVVGDGTGEEETGEEEEEMAMEEEVGGSEGRAATGGSDGPGESRGGEGACGLGGMRSGVACGLGGSGSERSAWLELSGVEAMVGAGSSACSGRVEPGACSGGAGSR